MEIWAQVLSEIATLSPAELSSEQESALKAFGLYRQRPREEGRYMLRLRLPNGCIRADQLGVVSRIAETYCGGRVDITTRQNIQFHGLVLADLPQIFAQIEAVGLTSARACGDYVRNVIGCPVSGLSPDEVADTVPLSQELNARFLTDPAFAKLPRKFKISVCGCSRHCIPTEVNDVGLQAVRDESGALGYALSVAGGLSVAPMMGKDLAVWIPEAEVVEVVTRIVEIFGDHGNFENRNRARLKFLLADWGIERFRNELESRLGRRFQDRTMPLPTASSRADHVGVHSQREAGKCYLGIPVKAGILNCEQLDVIVEMARHLGSGEIRLTPQQNVILPGIEHSELKGALDILADRDLRVDERSWRGRVVTCTGKEFCNRAAAPSKQVAAMLAEALDQADLPEAVGVRVSGCPHACSLHGIGEIGLQGRLTKTEQGMEACFDLWVGGGGEGPSLALGRRIREKLRPEGIPGAIEKLLERYRAERLPGEPFVEFSRRVLWESE